MIKPLESVTRLDACGARSNLENILRRHKGLEIPLSDSEVKILSQAKDIIDRLKKTLENTNV